MKYKQRILSAIICGVCGYIASKLWRGLFHLQIDGFGIIITSPFILCWFILAAFISGLCGSYFIRIFFPIKESSENVKDESGQES